MKTMKKYIGKVEPEIISKLTICKTVLLTQINSQSCAGALTISFCIWIGQTEVHSFRPKIRTVYIIVCTAVVEIYSFTFRNCPYIRRICRKVCTHG